MASRVCFLNLELSMLTLTKQNRVVLEDSDKRFTLHRLSRSMWVLVKWKTRDHGRVRRRFFGDLKIAL